LISVGLLCLSASAEDTYIWKRSHYGQTGCTDTVTKVEFRSEPFECNIWPGQGSTRMTCNGTVVYPTADCTGEPKNTYPLSCEGETSIFECVPKKTKVKWFRHSGSTTCSGTAEPAKLPLVDSMELIEAEIGPCMYSDGSYYKWTLTSGKLSHNKYSSKGCSGDPDAVTYSLTCDSCTSKDGKSHHLDCGGTMVLESDAVKDAATNATASGATNVGPSAAAVMALFSGVVVSL